jgi:hypothetical protein
MKVAQSTILRWVAKLAGQPRGQARGTRAESLRTLDTEQLRQVSGGTGASTQGPNKGW